MATRVERDPLGELHVPAEAYYGVQTQRAVENFPISGLRAPAPLVATLSEAIVQAADEILSGRFRDQFVVDVY
jgi:fumarate hydratase class II